MGDNELQDRLRDYSHSFDSLLSLIPAKVYYGCSEPNEPGKKKKQTKEQAKAAKKGKLDPDSELNRSAKEEMEERARTKRKLRELEPEDDDDDTDANDDGDSDISVLAGVEREKPGEGLKKKRAKEPEDEEDDEPSPKKVKVDEEEAEPEAIPAPSKKALQDEKKAAKEEKKAAKKAKLAEKLEKLGVAKKPTEIIPTPKKMSKEERKSAKKARTEEKQKGNTEKTSKKPKVVEEDDEDSEDDAAPTQPLTKPTPQDDLKVDDDGDMAPIDVSGIVEEDSSEPSSPEPAVFDTKPEIAEPASTTTSMSSAVPPSEKPRHIKIPEITDDHRNRLAAKLESLRASRKASGADGKQARTRDELIQQRREKQIQRREHKREMRLKAKEEEDRKREEALTSSRNSPMSMLSPMIHGNHGDDARNNHFSFGRLAFSDGTLMASDLSYEKSAAEKKGPSDPKTALAKLEAQKKRLSSLDADKRKEVLEKETWLAARRRAEGEKVHDSENLLKKAVKRKEKAKAKSEAQWKDRADGVSRAIKDKQRKREDNIKKRREEKGAKGKKKKGGVSTKSKARPGFEGSFGGGGKKK